MGARYYDPATGTFISQDPTGFSRGSTDLYSYAGDDPVNINDPTGCGCSFSDPTAGWSSWGAFYAALLVVGVLTLGGFAAAAGAGLGVGAAIMSGLGVAFSPLGGLATLIAGGIGGFWGTCYNLA